MLRPRGWDGRPDNKGGEGGRFLGDVSEKWEKWKIPGGQRFHADTNEKEERRSTNIELR